MIILYHLVSQISAENFMSLCFHTLLKERGFVHNDSNKAGLYDLLKGTGTRFYIGFDATGASLHVGHMMLLMVLRWALECQHRPLVLIGGATSQIGDPSGKSKTRNLLKEDIIKKNVKGIRQCLERALLPWKPFQDYTIVNNSKWLEDIKCLDFLRSIGKHFTINRMRAENHTIRERLDKDIPISFLEFTYGLFQAYDFLHLSRKYSCRIQIGGSDQWCNMLAGVDLIRREEQKEAYVLACPLLETADGKKMGKTEEGAIWLDPHMTSARDFWQYWRNIRDEDVEKCLKIFTTISLDEIATLIHGNIDEAKTRLADDITKHIHGKDSIKQGAQKSGKENNIITQHVYTDSYPEFQIGLLDAIGATEFAHSNGHARTLIQEGIVRVDGELVVSGEENRTLECEKKEKTIITIGGKKRILVLGPEGIKNLAEKGDAEAQNHLGMMYEDGNNVQENREKALKWYEKATEQGHREAEKNFRVLKSIQEARENEKKESQKAKPEFFRK